MPVEPVEPADGTREACESETASVGDDATSVGAAADGVRLEAELEAVTLAHRLQKLAGHGGDFRTDAVTRKKDDAVLGHGGPVRQDSR